ncbi:MAG: hypothetical protein ACE5HA_07995 [Anaerolineae bacterium]
MRVRPLWIVVALLIVPPALLFVGWRALPSAEISGRCTSLPSILPGEAGAVAFSRAFRTAILENPGGPFELRTTDVDLTSYVALNTQGRQLADPQIHFLDDTACFSGRLVGLGLVRPRFHLEVYPYTSAGAIRLEIRSFVVNGRLLPRSIRRLTQRITTESIQDANLPVRVYAVRVRDGEIVITGERLSGIGY